MVVLTGARDSGKTTLLKSLAVHTQGFLGLKTMADGKITSLELMLLPGGRIIPLAKTEPFPTEIRTGRFYFYEEAFGEIDRHFRILSGMPFIFDEFGPLEMAGQGHWPLFERLPKERLLVVVRPEMVPDFCGRFWVEQVLDVSDSATPARLRAWLSSFSA